LYQQSYYIDKSSNTFADSLAAFGLAFVLNSICDGRAQVIMEDAGPAFRVCCDPPIQEAWVKECRFFAGVPFLATWDRSSESMAIKGTRLAPHQIPPGDDLIVDYQVEREKRAQFLAWMSALAPEDRRKAARREIEGPAAPHPHWDVFRAINSGSIQGYNSLVAEWWQGRDAFQNLLQVLLQMTAQFPNDLERAEKAWNEVCSQRGWEKPKRATQMQLFNPAQGKGTNNAKATWSAPGNLKGFWLLEWLKATGLYYGGITRTLAGVKDRKTYVLMPRRLGWNQHVRVMQDFRQSMVRSETAIKLDILASLRYVKAFIQHYEDARQMDLAEDLFGEKPADLVRGMEMAFYKDLGNAVATMNIASLNLPRWVAPASPESLILFQQVLDEHISIIASLNETRGNQFDLLVRYRDFLSANDLTPFFRFTTAYSGFIMTQRERKQYVRQFSTTSLEVLMMNSGDGKTNYSQILQNEGFRNIAYAIRHSTVVPQSRKGRGDRRVVDIRYGLGQQLARKAAYPQDFLAEISEFLQLYNAENAQLREHNRNPFRKNVTTQDLEMLTQLVDQFGSRLICNMLVAYGYAREPYEAKDDEPPVEENPDDHQLQPDEDLEAEF